MVGESALTTEAQLRQRLEVQGMVGERGPVSVVSGPGHPILTLTL